MFDDWLTRIENGSLGGPYVQRVLVPKTLVTLHRAWPRVSTVTWDLSAKFLLITLLELSFFDYLLAFFSFELSFAGVLLLDMLLDFALVYVRGPHPVETADVLATLCMVISFKLLLAERYAVLAAVLFIASFNRETTWFTLPPVFLYEWASSRRLTRSLLALAAVAIPYFGLRLAMPSASWFATDAWRWNIPFAGVAVWEPVVANAHVLVFLGPLGVLACYRFREQPRFLRYVASIAPPFVAIHYAVGVVVEGRMWMPLLPVLIPPALTNLSRMFATADTKEQARLP